MLRSGWIRGSVISTLLLASACASVTPAPADPARWLCLSSLLDPIDLNAAGWAALDVADPAGAEQIDRHNFRHDCLCSEDKPKECPG